MKDQLDVTCYFFFTSYVLNMFRTSIYPSSGACNCVVELPRRCGNLTTQSQAPDNGYINVQNGCGNSTTQSQAPDDGYINPYRTNVENRVSS